MNIKAMAPIFSSVFLAEMGDKTQLATVCFTAGGGASKAEVFVASAAALVLSTFLAVACGAAIAKFISPALLRTVAGGLFIVMGGLFVYQGLAGL